MSEYGKLILELAYQGANGRTLWVNWSDVVVIIEKNRWKTSDVLEYLRLLEPHTINVWI